MASAGRGERRGGGGGGGRASRYVSFVVATKGPPGGFANRNRRPWSVYEFPQLGTGDKQIASYFCIQRLNGRRVWNDAAPRYRPTIIGEPASTSEEFQRAPQPASISLICVCARARARVIVPRADQTAHRHRRHFLLCHFRTDVLTLRALLLLRPPRFSGLVERRGRRKTG